MTLAPSASIHSCFPAANRLIIRFTEKREDHAHGCHAKFDDSTGTNGPVRCELSTCPALPFLPGIVGGARPQGTPFNPRHQPPMKTVTIWQRLTLHYRQTLGAQREDDQHQL